jgi:hypothetical protein
MHRIKKNKVVVFAAQQLPRIFCNAEDNAATLAPTHAFTFGQTLIPLPQLADCRAACACCVVVATVVARPTAAMMAMIPTKTNLLFMLDSYRTRYNIIYVV